MTCVSVGGDFRCRYNALEVERRFAQHPLYRTIFDVRTEKSLTLATIRYLLDALKGALKQ